MAIGPVAISYSTNWIKVR